MKHLKGFNEEWMWAKRYGTIPGVDDGEGIPYDKTDLIHQSIIDSIMGNDIERLEKILNGLPGYDWDNNFVLKTARDMGNKKIVDWLEERL